MTPLHPALTKAYDPVTFLERGASVPFTTPLLAGARARIGDAGGVELIVPNPSGAPGLYVLSWVAATDLCRPTVHDTRLHQTLATRRRLTPSVVRAAARAVAIEGLAGRDAQGAAEQATSAERELEDEIRFRLSLDLSRQSGVLPKGESAEMSRTPDNEMWVCDGLKQIADRYGWPASRLKAALIHIGRLFGDFGLEAGTDAARVPRVMKRLSQSRTEITEWASGRLDDAATDAATMAALAAQTMTCCDEVMGQLRRTLCDLSGLLRWWAEDRASLDDLAERPGWLIDGWERASFLWQSADTDPARCRSLGEMCVFAPLLPKEISAWIGAPIPGRPARPVRGLVRLNHDWRNGRIFELIPAAGDSDSLPIPKPPEMRFDCSDRFAERDDDGSSSDHPD